MGGGARLLTLTLTIGKRCPTPNPNPSPSPNPNQVPDCPTIRKEFERYGLVERAPGGGGFRVLPAALEAALAKLEPAGAAKPPKKTPNRNW